MNIIYVYRSFAVFGGVERIFIDKANYLADKSGHTVYLITTEQCDRPITYPLSDKVIHIDLNIHFYTQYQYKGLKRLQVLMQLERELHRRLAELVMHLKADIIICTSFEFTTMKIVTKLQGSVKKIVEAHGSISAVEEGNRKQGNYITRLTFKLKDQMLYRYIKRADAFVSLTSNDANDWKFVVKAYVIPNILTNYPKQIDKVNKRGKRVISAGRLVEQKGYDLLLKAWQIVNLSHPDWVLDIYGDGEEKIMLLEEAKRQCLGQSVCIHSPTNSIYKRYMESDFYVMSSRWEGFGLVLTEAMSCGLPCVSFDCPHGPSDIIRDGEDGILVENGNIGQLAEKINWMIEHEDIRLQMGERARENVKRYLPDHVMPQWEHLFQSLIK